MIELIHASLAGSTVIAIDMHSLLTKVAHDEQFQIFLLLFEVLLVESGVCRISEHQYEVVDCHHSEEYIVKRKQYRQYRMIDICYCSHHKSMEHDDDDYQQERYYHGEGWGMRTPIDLMISLSALLRLHLQQSSICNISRFHFEVGMLQCQFAADPLRRLHGQALRHQAQQFLIVHQQLVYSLEANYLLPSCYPIVRPPLVHLPLGKIGSQLIPAALQHLSRQLCPIVLDDHQQVLEVIVGCEEQAPCGEFCEDAPDTPDIAGLGPVVALEDYFGSAVLTGVYDRAVLLGFVSSTPKVNQLYLGPQREAVVCEGIVLDTLELVGAQEYILRLQVCMGISLLVHEPNGFEELPGKALHIPPRIAMMPILLDDLIQRRSKGLKHHAEVAVVIERLFESNYMCCIIWVSLVQGLYYVSLDAG